MEIPFVLITISYIFGILFGKSIQIEGSIIFSAIVVFAAFSIYAILKKINLSYVLLIMVFIVGIFAVQTVAPPIRQFKNNKIEKRDLISTVADTIRQKFNLTLTQILPPNDASLLGSILLGTSVSPLSEDLVSDYRRSGLIHLLVVSGTQISILLGLILSISKLFNFPMGITFFFATLFNIMLIVVTGGGASIVRAGIMG